MVSRARVVTLFLSLFVVNPFTHAQIAQPNSSVTSQIAALEGKVINSQGVPVPGIHIEIDDASTAMPLTSTYTQPDGTFALSNIPKGNYEVVADSGAMEVSNEVSVESGKHGVELRLPSNGPATTTDATISVARMLVPNSAQKLYNKAYVSFQKGKYSEAEKQLDAALVIHPEFADAIALRGLLQLNTDIDAARASLEKAIQLDPAESAAYIALAAVYNHEGRFDEAMQSSEKGLSLRPHAWQAYLELAKSSIAKSMYQRALKLIREAQRLGGNAFAEVHLVKAYALVPLKLYSQARCELQASLAHEKQGALAEKAKGMLAQLTVLESTTIADNR